MFKNKFGIEEPSYKTNIGKVHFSYSTITEKMYVNGRIIDLVKHHLYYNFDDWYETDDDIQNYYIEANKIINKKLFIDNFTVNISQMTVKKIEFSFNVNTQYVAEYIRLFNSIYIQNKSTRFRNYTNFTTENNKQLNTSFYLKTNSDYKDNEENNFCLNIYNKQNQLIDKRTRIILKYGKSKITENEIVKAKNVLRIECKVFRNYLNSLCKTLNIKKDLESLLNKDVAILAISAKMSRFFGDGDYYSISTAKNKLKNNGFDPDFNIQINQLSEYKYKKYITNLNNAGICPYGFLPDDWGIDYLPNPVKLIKTKLIKRKENMTKNKLTNIKIYSNTSYNQIIEDICNYRDVPEYEEFCRETDFREAYPDEYEELISEALGVKIMKERREKAKLLAEEKKKKEHQEALSYLKEKEIFDTKDIQTFFSSGKRQAYELMNSNTFPSFSLNSKRYITRKKLEEWLEKNTGKTISL